MRTTSCPFHERRERLSASLPPRTPGSCLGTGAVIASVKLDGQDELLARAAARRASRCRAARPAGWPPMQMPPRPSCRTETPDDRGCGHRSMKPSADGSNRAAAVHRRCTPAGWPHLQGLTRMPMESMSSMWIAPWPSRWPGFAGRARWSSWRSATSLTARVRASTPGSGCRCGADFPPH